MIGRSNRILRNPLFRVLWLILVCTGVAFAQTPANINQSGLHISLYSTAPCALSSAPEKITVRGIGGFNDSVPFAAYLTRLIAQARETKADAIFDIQILPSPPGYGGSASASFGKCAPTGEGVQTMPLAPSILDGVSQALTCEEYEFSAGIGILRRGRTVQDAEPKLESSLPTEPCTKLKIDALNTSNYDMDVTVKGSCPFLPSIGYRFVSRQGLSVWMLVSSDCSSNAVFVTPDQDWRSAATYQLNDRGRAALLPER